MAPNRPAAPNGAAPGRDLQSSITSFFRPRAPQYAPLPSPTSAPAPPTSARYVPATNALEGAAGVATTTKLASSPTPSEWVDISPPSVTDLHLCSTNSGNSSQLAPRSPPYNFLRPQHQDMGDGSYEDENAEAQLLREARTDIVGGLDGVKRLDEVTMESMARNTLMKTLSGASIEKEENRKDARATVPTSMSGTPILVPTTLGVRPARPIHPKTKIVPIQSDHVQSIKRINALLLCVTYPSNFYQQLSPPTAYSIYSRTILWSPNSQSDSAPIVVGSLVTRRDPLLEKNGLADEKLKGDESSLYIAALTLLSPYRGLGLAQAALESVIRQCIATPGVGDGGKEGGGIRSLYAHVWTNNTEGLEWYRKMGFRTESVVDGYYPRMKPSTALILRRDIGVADRLKGRGEDSESPESVTSNGATSIKDSESIRAHNVKPHGLEGSSNLEKARDTMAESTFFPPPEKKSSPPPLKRPSLNTAGEMPATQARSFMSQGPQIEWNDLPEHMVKSRSGPPSAARSLSGARTPISSMSSAPPSGPPSAPPSRTATPASGGTKKKRGRAYPTAALEIGSGMGSGSSAS